jgi:hypothetical protein
MTAMMIIVIIGELVIMTAMMIIVIIGELFIMTAMMIDHCHHR